VKDPKESTYTFDTGGGTQHITQSFKTKGSYPAPGFAAPDFRGAIGVTHEDVEGVDITVPVYNFSETHYIDDALVEDAVAKTLVKQPVAAYVEQVFEEGDFSGLGIS